MGDDKIRITWDDVNSEAVDQKLKQREMLDRMHDHHEQQYAGVDLEGGGPNIWYNTLFYMGMFGLFGGLAAWGLGEAVEVAIPVPIHQYGEYRMKCEEVEDSIASGEMTAEEAAPLLRQLESQYADNPYVQLENDESLGASSVDDRMATMQLQDVGKMYLSLILFSAFAGISIAVSLGVAEQVVGKNWRGVLVNGSIAAITGLLGGSIGGFLAQLLYMLLLSGSDDPGMLQQVFARTIGWGFIGMFLAIAPGIVLRSWKRFVIGLVGGGLGGLIGGVLFDLIGGMTDEAVLSRLVGLVSIAVIAGVATGLIETVAKSGWLRVVGGLIAGKQFILYKDPTYIGSSPKCEIYLFKDASVGPRHAAIHKIPGGFEVEDLRSGGQTIVNGRQVSRSRLKNGDQIQIGATLLQFHEKE